MEVVFSLAALVNAPNLSGNAFVQSIFKKLQAMTNSQCRMIASPLVMVAGSLYSLVPEGAALLMGGLVFLLGAGTFCFEWVKSYTHES